MAHDSRCENADTPPSDCSCECGGSKHGNGFAEEQIHDLETDIPEIEELKKLTPDEYFGEDAEGPELIEKAYLKLGEVIDEALEQTQGEKKDLREKDAKIAEDEDMDEDEKNEELEAIMDEWDEIDEQFQDKVNQFGEDRSRLSDIVEVCDNRGGADNWSFVDREYDGFNIDAVWENNDNGEAVTVNEDNSGYSTVYNVEYPGLSGSEEFMDENIAMLHARNWMRGHPEGNGEGAKTIDVLNKGEADGTRNS